MTYCVGIKAQDGIVFASDSRTNAGLDNVNIYSKMFVHDVGDRSVIIVTSGNFGTSQAVYKSIENDLKGDNAINLNTCKDFFTRAKTCLHMLKQYTCKNIFTRLNFFSLASVDIDLDNVLLLYY